MSSDDSPPSRPSPTDRTASSNGSSGRAWTPIAWSRRRGRSRRRSMSSGGSAGTNSGIVSTTLTRTPGLIAGGTVTTITRNSGRYTSSTRVLVQTNAAANPRSSRSRFRRRSCGARSTNCSESDSGSSHRVRVVVSHESDGSTSYDIGGIGDGVPVLGVQTHFGRDRAECHPLVSDLRGSVPEVPAVHGDLVALIDEAGADFVDRFCRYLIYMSGYRLRQCGFAAAPCQLHVIY